MAARRMLGAFTLIELAVIVVTLALLAAAILPALAREKRKSQRERCTNNLKQQGLAFRVFAHDNSDRSPSELEVTHGGTKGLIAPGMTFLQFRALSNGCSSPQVLTCPADTRRPVTNWTALTESNLSYFVGVDAKDSTPMTLLSGDRNLTLNGAPVPPGLLAVTTNSLLGWSTTMHRRAGNVAFGDGSVDQTWSAKLVELISHQDVTTNRLLVP